MVVLNKKNKPAFAKQTCFYGNKEICSKYYLAKLTARVSRITVIFTCPG